jgi:hypothetical protein
MTNDEWRDGWIPGWIRNSQFAIKTAGLVTSLV